MLCPYCKKKCHVDDVVFLNLQSYGGGARARTQCCGKIVYVSIHYSFSADETRQTGQDDWGR